MKSRNNEHAPETEEKIPAEAKAGKVNAAAKAVEAVIPSGSWRRLAVGVAAAAGGGLFAAITFGVGPVAIAGAAGYVAYRGITERRQKS